MLAMSFLGTMLVGIASLTMRITNIYQKGLSIRSINANGREIVSDLTRIIGASRINFNDINPSGNKIDEYMLRATRSNYYVYTVDNETSKRQLGGAFCTGDYSYVWNTADNIRIARQELSSGTEVKNLAKKGVYVIKAGKSYYYVPKFARFIDKERYACSHEEDNYYPSKDTKNEMKKDDETQFNLGDSKTADSITELIEDNEADLALYNFTVYPASQHTTTKQIFYSGMFILATVRGGVNVMANGDFCQGTDNDDGSKTIKSDGTSEFNLNDFDYCAVNKYNFSARATGEAGINRNGE
jgi:hypothetical protein